MLAQIQQTSTKDDKKNFGKSFLHRAITSANIHYSLHKLALNKLVSKLIKISNQVNCFNLCNLTKQFITDSFAERN